jgi:hypothetical protein
MVADVLPMVINVLPLLTDVYPMVAEESSVAITQKVPKVIKNQLATLL